MEALDLKSIKLAQQGDEEAFSTIYHQFYNRIFYYALKLSKNEADAKDITQETFIQIHKSIKDLRKPEYFPLWVNRIINSKFHKQLKRYKETAIEQEDLIYHLDHSERSIKQAQDLLLDDADVFMGLINSLTPKQSEILRLMYFEQRTSIEIASLLDLPEGTVKSRIHQGKLALKRKIMSFEKREGRKLTFHADIAMPIIFLPFMYKLKDIFQHSSTASQVALVATSLSTVLITSTAVVTTIEVTSSQNKPMMNPSQEQLTLSIFKPVYYQNDVIDNAKSAYYKLKAWAPTADQVSKRSDEEKQQVQSIVNNLKESNTAYYHQLESSGWIEAYN